MEHQNGQQRAVWASLRELTSSRNQTAHSVVQPTTRSTHKNGELNMMAQYASCTLQGRRDCRACQLRVQCLAHGNEAKRARRVSAVLRPIEGPSPPPEPAASPVPATQPILWGDWSRCQTRRRLMSLLRTQTVTITLPPAADPVLSGAERGPLTRQQRKHARLTWEQRLARNALSASEPDVKLHLFGIPTAFAQAIGLLSLA
jgi:hypothetical protein